MQLIEQDKKTRSDLYGAQKENLATEFLKKQGYKILERNHKNKMGEIDIIAFDDSDARFIFVEVKARKNNRFGYGRDSVNREKLFKITSAAQMYLKSKKLSNVKMRFDVIEIMGESITHLKAIL